MTEIMIYIFAVVWLAVSCKRLIRRIKMLPMSEEEARKMLSDLIGQMMDMLLEMDGMPVRLLTSIIVLLPLLMVMLDLGGYFFGFMYGRGEQIDNVALLFFSMISVLDYVRQYPGFSKFKTYIEDGLQKEAMERKIFELVDHETKIKGVGHMAAIGATAGSLYLCYVLFIWVR